jgi:hypothetical protein
VETSATYGRIKYAIFEQAWTILLLGEQGKQTNTLDRAAMNQAIAAYDRALARGPSIDVEFLPRVDLVAAVWLRGC